MRGSVTDACPACGHAASRRSYLGRGQFEWFAFEYRDCASCGTQFVSPMPDAPTLDALYSPHYIGAGAAEPCAEKDADVRSEMAGTARRVAELRPGGRLLDIGCGAGEFLLAARAARLAVEGHELVAATALHVERATGIKVHSGPLASLGASFDVVHFADVLEHCTSPLDVLVEAAALLAPGGLLVARGPLEAQPSLFERVVRWNRRAHAATGRAKPSEVPPWHVSLFTLEGWRALSTRAGLRVVEERVDEAFWPASPAARDVRHWVKRASIRVARSPIGKRMKLGNRVVSILVPLREG